MGWRPSTYALVLRPRDVERNVGLAVEEFAEAPPPSGLPLSRRVPAIVAMSFGTALVVMDNNIAAVALPSIARSLRISNAACVMIITVYQMVLLMAVLPFSALGDWVGLKRIYQGGQALFLMSTVLSALATNLPMLLLARGCQALGVAGVLGVGTALLRRVYPAAQLGRAFGINGLIIASASASAPLLGGLLLAFGSWRWVFAAAAPFAVVSLLLGRSLPVAPSTRLSYDFTGALLCAATVGLLFGSLQAIHTPRLGVPLAALLFVCGAVIGTIFVRRELAQSAPILPVDLLSNRGFALPVLAAFAAFTGSMLFILSLPFRLEGAYGLSPSAVGSILAVWPLTMAVMALVAGLLSERSPPGLMGGFGMACASGGLVWSAALTSHASLLRIIWPLMLCGAGFGLFLSPNSHQIMKAAPHHRAASAGGLISTVRLAGSTFGATLLAFVLSSHLGTGRTPCLIAAGFLALACIASLCSLQVNKKHQKGASQSVSRPFRERASPP